VSAFQRTSTPSLDDFQQLVGETFEVESYGVDLVLVEASPIASPSSPRARPFSLLFRGPLDGVLDQRTHRMSQATLGSLDVFLVPVERDERGVLYEAVFN